MNTRANGMSSNSRRIVQMSEPGKPIVVDVVVGGRVVAVVDVVGGMRRDAVVEVVGGSGRRSG